MHTDETLIYGGGDVKAMGAGRVSGLCIPFGTPDTADIQGDYFTPSTYLGIHERWPVLVDHGLGRVHGAREFGVGTIDKKADGFHGSTVLDLADPAAARLYARAEAGGLFWSSGSVARMVGRRAVDSKSEVTRWPLVELSLTETPVDRRNRLQALKSLILQGDESPGRPAVPATLVDRTEALVADAEGLRELYRAAIKSRAAESRRLSPAKRAALKSLVSGLAALLAEADGPDPATVAALSRRILTQRIGAYRRGQ